VADELAVAGLLAAAVTVWLNVVRYHGESIAHGLTAAACLVRTGHRDKALAAIDESLAGKLSAPVIARLTAHRRWIVE